MGKMIFLSIVLPDDFYFINNPPEYQDFQDIVYNQHHRSETPKYGGNLQYNMHYVK